MRGGKRAAEGRIWEGRGRAPPPAPREDVAQAALPGAASRGSELLAGSLLLGAGCPCVRASWLFLAGEERLGAGTRFLTHSSCWWVPVVPRLSHSHAWGESGGAGGEADGSFSTFTASRTVAELAGDAKGLAGGFGLPTVSQGSSSALRQLGLLTVKLVAGKAQICRLIQRASEFMEKLH